MVSPFTHIEACRSSFPIHINQGTKINKTTTPLLNTYSHVSFRRSINHNICPREDFLNYHEGSSFEKPPRLPKHPRHCRRLAFLPELLSDVDFDKVIASPGRARRSEPASHSASSPVHAKVIHSAIRDYQPVTPTSPSFPLMHWDVILSNDRHHTTNRNNLSQQKLPSLSSEPTNENNKNVGNSLQDVARFQSSCTTAHSIFKTLREEFLVTRDRHEKEAQEKFEWEATQMQKQKIEKNRLKHEEIKRKHAEELEQKQHQKNEEKKEREPPILSTAQPYISRAEAPIAPQTESTNCAFPNGSRPSAIDDYAQLQVTNPSNKKQLDGYVQSKLQLRSEWKKYQDGELFDIKRDLRREIYIFRVATKKKINLAVNQLALTESQIEQVSQKLLDIPNSITPSTVSLPQQQLERYVLSGVILAILDNAEIQLVTNPKAVWGFGRLLRRLNEWNGFRQTFEAALLGRCIYIIPYYVTKSKNMGQTDFEENRRQNESEVHYFQRMTGYLKLWLAYIGALQDRETIWSWFSRFLSLNPKRISCYLLSGALEVAGFIGLYYFPVQFKKLLLGSVPSYYMPKLRLLQTQDREGHLTSAVIQIQLQIGHLRKTGRLEIPEGFEMKFRATDIDPNI